MMVLLQLLATLIERLGVRVAGVLLIVVGIIEIIPATILPPYVTLGGAFIAGGIGLIAFGQKAQKAQRQFISSEAEKRIADPSLPSASTIPAIQREIEKKLADPATAKLDGTAVGRMTGAVPLTPQGPAKP